MLPRDTPGRGRRSPGPWRGREPHADPPDRRAGRRRGPGRRGSGRPGGGPSTAGCRPTSARPAGAAGGGRASRSTCSCASPTTTSRSGAAPPGRRGRGRASSAGSTSTRALFGRFRDSDGRPPRHTFFYPVEEYEPEYLDALAGLCRAGLRRGRGPPAPRRRHGRRPAADAAASSRTTLADRHGLLSRDRADRRARPTASSTATGPWTTPARTAGGAASTTSWTSCARPGCYADFTLPSAPSPTQTPQDQQHLLRGRRPAPARSRTTPGRDVGDGPARPTAAAADPGAAACSTGGSRKWGLLPRIENGCLQGSQPPTHRAARRSGCGRASRSRPGPTGSSSSCTPTAADEANQPVLLGEPMVRFHEALADRPRRDPHFHFHYVTAREMYNLARAAEAGWAGPGRRRPRLPAAQELAPPVRLVGPPGRAPARLARQTHPRRAKGVPGDLP